MKSTLLIHEIIERFGSDVETKFDNRDLMKALKALRKQVVIEAQATQRNANAYLKLKYK